MATVAELREAITANLNAHLTDIQATAYMLSNPTPPTIQVYPGGPAGDLEYDLAMARGLDQWMFTVQAFVGVTGDIAAQKRLDVYIASSGPQSVKAAIESDPTLGGLGSCRVQRCGGYRTYTLETGSYLGAEWYVQVLATGG